MAKIIQSTAHGKNIAQVCTESLGLQEWEMKRSIPTEIPHFRTLFVVPIF
jgi:hypothetical protein